MFSIRRAVSILSAASWSWRVLFTIFAMRRAATLVLTDAAGQYQPFSGYETIPYHQTPSGGSTLEQGIGQWAPEDSVTPGILRFGRL